MLFLGSTCIYPKAVEQPMREDALLTDVLEPTNEPYALAKIAGIKLCESYNRQHGTDFRSVMPTNLYGEGDNFNLENSHVIPAVMRKLHLAKQLENNDWQAIKQDITKNPIKGITENSTNNQILKILAKQGIKQLTTQDLIEGELPLGKRGGPGVLTTDNSQLNEVEVNLWGTGKAMREFLYIDDMAQASLFVLELDENTYQDNTQSILSHINVGTGRDVTIREMAETMKQVVGYKGEMAFDTTKPDGASRKLIDVTRLKNMGWTYSTNLKDGLEKVYKWYVDID